MSTAPDQALIVAQNLGPLTLTSTLAPVFVRGSAADQARSQPPLKRRSWKTVFRLASLFLAVVAAVVVYQPWHRLMPRSAAAEGEAATAPVTVAIARPSPAGSSDIVLPATFRPWQTATLHARVSGYLTAWHRDLGSQVKAGELLAEIETPELDQQLAEGEALVREAAAALLQAKAERVEAQADLKAAEAQLLRTQAEHELAKSLLGRREKLLKTRVITQEEYDISRRQLEARSAEVAAAEADVNRRRSNLETRTAIIAARDAVVGSRQANVDRLEELQRFGAV
jgi:multidrug resistance efflux pump